MKLSVRTGNIEEVVGLSYQIPEFDNHYSAAEYAHRLRMNYLILIAESDGIPAGFKVGYDRFEDGVTFYSWIGGVLPEYRKAGVGRLLLKKMEVWCKLKGYVYLEFKTNNRFKSMIHFALNQDFLINGFEPREDPEDSWIYFRKKL